MKKIDDLFTVKNGIPTTGLILSKSRSEGLIAFLRPSSSQARTLSGWIEKALLRKEQVYPAQTLFVSTNGEGSHSYAYVSPLEFACNSVSVLLPKLEMTLTQKIFYAHCITMNRFRFSYGRKPKGSRLKTMELPDYPEEWSLKMPTLTWS